jgi:HD-GYP domain-containing protein (c-di-GMP phosphodiesterase class II)
VRCVSIDALKPGDRLGRDVQATPGSLPLLRAGIRLSESYRRSLERAGVAQVWIDDGISEGIEPLEILEDETKQLASVAIKDAFTEITGSMRRPEGPTISTRLVKEMERVAELIIRDIARNVHSALALNDLATADGYTLKHSLSVTTLGLTLGYHTMRMYGWTDALDKKRFDGIEDRLEPLGVGLLLHDIGKLAVPHDILHKAGPLTSEEWAAVKEHPVLGVDILKKSDAVGPLARAVVRSHHERWDGSGYPHGRAREEIHQFARIAAVADVFDALASDRCYRKAMPQHEAHAFITERAGKDFDPEVVTIFKTVVAPYRPGTTVLLSDGRGGLVQEARQGHVSTPIVRIILDAAGQMVTPYEVDLSKNLDVTIVSTDLEVPAADQAA